MDFVELVGAGLLVAGATAGLGVWIAKNFTDKAQETAAERERKAAEAAEAAAAERERTRAAATEFSRAYGQFFAVWKAWDDHLHRQGRVDEDGDPLAAPPPAHRDASSDRARLELLMRAADAEGLLESFVVRLCVDRPLSRPQLDRLWCFRRAYRELRYAVREDRPLDWRRADSKRKNDPRRRIAVRTYRAFKGLAVHMVELFTIDHEPAVDAPDPMSATERLLYVTGPSDGPSESHHASIEAFAGELRRHRPGVKTRYSRWVAIYEDTERAQAARRVPAVDAKVATP